ncbi:SPT16-domain-containing protein [Metschnikowia bicuspidata var. bicuspidata NRRL YB-4993]|uniref:FACT complex subunit n=1 Tax=Metschnikowia bicuspidata var. bicuspidata NRRL YB-4993 TaxID=869754 RepID=A0A1A0HJL9_9ASCO|nr:SPT16-domain-containing protein [Metschnikowia bicuspidata var. bicuspidata NRRL YB-4993]OBA24191.1 SPT16-domain-containing protein [Metschnikowia bicuspidata var. bicuspidata NRRL YB-4993]
MSDVVIDAAAFFKRVSIIQKRLADPGQRLASLLFLLGTRDDESTYKKSIVFQLWLLGYEFAHTAIYIDQHKCIVVTSEGKAKHLQPLAAALAAAALGLEVWARTKDADHNKGLFTRLARVLQAQGSAERPVGVIAKDLFKGKFIDEWTQAALALDLPTADAALFVSESMALKDADEFRATLMAARASAVMMDSFANDMMELVDNETKTSNVDISDRLDKKIDLNRWYTKSALGKKTLQASKDFDPELVDWCYSPIVQSGGDYDLRPSAVSLDKRFVGDGAILSSLGLRYRNYCSNIARTFMIDPPPAMEANYDVLLGLQLHLATSLLRDGKSAREVYDGAADFVRSRNPDLVDKLTKNVGWLTGIEFRDSTLILNLKTERTLVNGQIISLTIGFHSLSNESAPGPQLKTYALLLTDTYKVGENEAIALTNYQKARKEVTFYFKEDGKPGASRPEPSDRKVKPEKDAAVEKKLALNDANSKILKSKLRNESAAADDVNAEKLRQDTQRLLHERREQEGLARFSKADATDDSDLRPIFKRYESYVRESQIPSNVKDLKIHIDYKSHTIILPICGRPVPFHINSFKNGSQNEEGDYTYLRLNFNSPGAGGANSRRTELPYEDSPDNLFVRSLTFRSRDRQRMIDVYKAIQDLKKDSVKREAEKKQLADVVTQGNLVELKGSRMKKLEQVFVRPTADTKKIGGVLQIHENGLRYQSSFRADQKIDILFSNIKHLFFQPCKEELIVIIHCHLKSPIMIGKRKTHDVQFYREASDMAFDETGGRKRKYRYGDEDELQQEQEERKRKAMLDKEFKSFAELISDASRGAIDLDIPFRELGFQGVPFRSAVFCMPTRDCLISLIDPPYLVVTLEEIEIAHLERVQFGLKNFDLVFVFKDFLKPVVHINTIPMELLEDIKNWLTNVDIPFSEGQMNLNWGALMKTITADPYAFFSDGGWRCLTGDGESDEENSEDEESEFEASDEDPSDEDVASEEDSEDAYSSDGSEGSGSGEEDESDDGDDWDELERKAARDDSRRGRE